MIYESMYTRQLSDIHCIREGDTDLANLCVKTFEPLSECLVLVYVLDQRVWFMVCPLEKPSMRTQS